MASTSSLTTIPSNAVFCLYELSGIRRAFCSLEEVAVIVKSDRTTLSRHIHGSLRADLGGALLEAVLPDGTRVGPEKPNKEQTLLHRCLGSNVATRW
jgi:hypothetical protein